MQQPHSFKEIPLSRSIFVWKLLHGKLATEDILRVKGFSLPFMYRLCWSSVETLTHLFLRCPFFMFLWHSISSIFKIKVDYSSFASLFKKASTPPLSPRFAKLYLVAFISSLLIIWWTRNRNIFYNNIPSLHFSLAITLVFVKEASKLIKEKGSNPIHDFLISCMLGVHVSSRPPPSITLVFWFLPNPSWLKLNIDGSSLEYPGFSACGGIFRNYKGFIKDCFSIP